MFLYFWKRLLHKKNFYLALLAGAMLSMLYIAKDVYPYRALKYGHSVYTIWMGGFNGSIYASLFYLLVPLLAAIPMAGHVLSDRQAVIINLCRLEIRQSSIFVDYTCAILRRAVWLLFFRWR